MHDEHDRPSLAALVYLTVIFNAIPLLFVVLGEWTPFDVMAFYWIEVIAAGIFACLALAVTGVYQLRQSNSAAGLSSLSRLFFMPFHFGFFVVMMCFMIGTFLPDDTPKVALTSPLVPFYLVVENAHLSLALPIALLWHAFRFGNGYLREERFKTPEADHPVRKAYIDLFILFFCAFFGMAINAVMADRIWGAIPIVVVKTLCAVAALYGNDKLSAANAEAGEEAAEDHLRLTVPPKD